MSAKTKTPTILTISMEWVIALVVIVIFVIWFMKGVIGASERNRAKNEEWEEYADAMRKNREADELLNDPDYVKRLLREDND